MCEIASLLRARIWCLIFCSEPTDHGHECFGVETFICLKSPWVYITIHIPATWLWINNNHIIRCCKFSHSIVFLCTVSTSSTIVHGKVDVAASRFTRVWNENLSSFFPSRIRPISPDTPFFVKIDSNKLTLGKRGCCAPALPIRYRLGYAILNGKRCHKIPYSILPTWFLRYMPLISLLLKV